MAEAANITPVLSLVLATAEPPVVAATQVPNDWEYFYDVRVTNYSASPANYTLALGPDAAFANAGYRAFNLEVGAGMSLDVELGLFLPAGFRFFHRASTAAALHVWFTGTKRAVA